MKTGARHPSEETEPRKVSLAGAATSIIFVATKLNVCCDKHNFVSTISFVATSILLLR